MNLRQQNLNEILRRFNVRGTTSKAKEELEAQARGGGAWDLSDLLRHHADEMVDEDDEVEMRDAFDDLLACFGCLEIAAVVDLIPDPLPKSTRKEIALALCNPDLRKYYRAYYPLYLPDMLLARVAGTRKLRKTRGKKATDLCLEFIQLNGILEDDPDVALLLWFLDDGFEQGYSFEDTLELVSNPNRLLRALQKSPRRRNPAEQAAAGLRTFFTFCVAFDDLLQRCSRYEVLQSAMWEYHAYWFRILGGQVRASLEDAIEQLRCWLSSPASKHYTGKEVESLRLEAKESMDKVLEVVRRLTGRQYGKSIRGARQRIRRDSAAALRLLKWPASTSSAA